MKSWLGRALVAAALATLWSSWPARAVVDTVVVTYSGGTATDATDYLPGTDNLGVPAILPAGRTLQYRVLTATLPHDLMSTACSDGARTYESMNIGGSCPDGGQRLFASDIGVPNQQKPVFGTSALAPGEYGFYCSVHGSAMAGTLRVVGA